MLAALSILLILVLGDVTRAHQLKTQAERDLSAANYKFSFDLYKRLVKPSENLIVSGVSVSTALSMLLSGSDGKTYRELASALSYHNLTREDLHGAYPGILSALKGNGSYDLSVANSVWSEKSFAVLSSYQQVVRSAYNSELRSLNIPTSKSDINAWVKEKTHGMIPDMLKDNLSRDTVMTLFNAIFFKGKWAQPFNNKTVEGGFLDNDIYIADYPSATTEMMSTKGRFNYTDSKELGAYLVDLPYEGGDVSMTVVLPHFSLLNLEANLTSVKLQQAINRMYSRKVEVTLPVFDISSEIDLNQPLQSLGVNEIFGDRANFSHISPYGGVKVSQVFQKAKIEVSVEGTKASAATGIIIKTASIELPPIDFRANRPFLFLLRHKPTNTVMFTGRYTVCKPYRK